MKKISFLMVLSLFSTLASAECFQFVNGKGPDRVGNIRFAATATTICVQNVNRMAGGSYTSVHFSDSQGDLAIISAQVSAQGRCASLCKVLTLGSGNNNGYNVDFSGTQLSITTQRDEHLGMSNGVVEIKAGRDFPQKFLIIGQ